MTIGIAVTLPDGVLLVADGRQTWPLAAGKPPNSDVDKLRQIGPTVFAITFGVTQATSWALTQLKKMFVEGCKPEAFAAQLEASVRSGWDTFIANLAPDVDRNHPAMKAALVAGGLVAGGPFIAGFLCSSRGNMPTAVLRKGPSMHSIVLGGEEQRTEEMFNQRAERSLQGLPWQPDVGPANLWVGVLLKAAVDVIRFVEAQNPTIGGTIRYAVVRENFPVKKAVWIE